MQLLFFKHALAIAKADTTSFIDGWYVVVKDSSIITSYLKDIYENSNIYDELKEYYGKIQYSYSFNLNGSRANRAKTEKSIQKQLQKKFANCSIESRELSRESFYELYGGFLFIGIFLGIIFLMATTSSSTTNRYLKGMMTENATRSCRKSE